MSVVKEYGKEKVSIIGSIISVAGIVFNKFYPTKIPIASQSFFETGEAGLIYISLGVLAVLSLITFLIIGVVRAHRRHKRKK